MIDKICTWKCVALQSNSNGQGLSPASARDECEEDLRLQNVRTMRVFGTSATASEYGMLGEL